MTKFEVGINQIARNEVHTLFGFIIKETNTLNEIKTRNRQEFIDVVKMERVVRIGPIKISRRVYGLEYGKENSSGSTEKVLMGFTTK